MFHVEQSIDFSRGLVFTSSSALSPLQRATEMFHVEHFPPRKPQRQKLLASANSVSSGSIFDNCTVFPLESGSPQPEDRCPCSSRGLISSTRISRLWAGLSLLPTRKGEWAKPRPPLTSRPRLPRSVCERSWSIAIHNPMPPAGLASAAIPTA